MIYCMQSQEAWQHCAYKIINMTIARAGWSCQQLMYTLPLEVLPGSAKELEVAADSAKYLSDAVHMHSLTDPAQDLMIYLSSTPEQRTLQQLAVSSIDKRTLVKEYTYSIAARAIQVTLHCIRSVLVCSAHSDAS